MRWLRVTLGVAGAMLGMACSNSGPTRPGGVTTLVEITPPPRATGVDPAGPIVVRFSGAMGGGMERYMDLHRGDVAGPLVPMSCAWSTDRRTLTCTPGGLLQSGTRYTIHLGSAMIDADGHAVETEQHGMQLGGQSVTGQTMGPMHGGEPGGVAFTFETR
jgi:hypothetical protein